MKKLLLSLLALGTALTVIPMFAAFEAHVINVTARIENALAVSARALDFGTVFPQEQLDRPITVALSGSFMDEGRVDDVSYFIRQKPKCAITSENGEVADLEHTATGHVIVGENNEVRIDCGEAPRILEAGESWGALPSLCEYISKELNEDDGAYTPSFHKPWSVDDNGQLHWTDTFGHLAKSDNDISDTWTIDLAVPCFGGFCAQDWADFVHGINPTADPAAYTQPIANEHKIFGCDLWVEVAGVSETPIVD